MIKFMEIFRGSLLNVIPLACDYIYILS